MDINKIIDNMNAVEKLKNGINGMFKTKGFPKSMVKAATISNAAISML